jgi:hypothetical protein
MNLESRKINLINWISSIQEENIFEKCLLKFAILPEPIQNMKIM